MERRNEARRRIGEQSRRGDDEEIGPHRIPVQAADADETPLLILGGGSNVVISDDGWRGTVLLIRTQGFEVAADASLTGVQSIVEAALADGRTVAERSWIAARQCIRSNVCIDGYGEGAR